MSEEQQQPSEKPSEVELEPLKPLEPDITSAMAKVMEGTPIEIAGPTVDVKTTVVPYRRRIAPLSNETCPHGLAGFCLICPRCPCTYLKARTLRNMIAELEYGK